MTVVATRDGAGLFSTYVDGVASVNIPITDTGAFSDLLLGAGPLAFFNMSVEFGNLSFSGGFVDDIRIWSSVLSAPDIATLGAGLAGDLVTPEPASLLLLGTGLVVVARQMRKKKKAGAKAAA